MKRRILLFSLAFLIAPLLCPDAQLKAACDGSDMTGSAYCVYSGGFGTAGGDLDGATFDLLASNMYPYQQRDTSADLEYWYNKAVADYTDGENYRLGLLLIDPAPSPEKMNMLLDTKLNYETAGLLADFANIEAKLISARDTFAYSLFIGYGSESEARLLAAIKSLANLYLMIGDELLIDALEYRFSDEMLGIDSKLDEQICLLGAGKTDPSECRANATPSYTPPQHGAQYYYEKAVNSFIYGFSPAVGTTIYVSDYFDDAVFRLFNLSTERLSMALREKSSKQFVRQMSPDSTQEWKTARQTALSIIRDLSISMHLSAAAAADKAQQKGMSFDATGGDSLSGALAALRKQGNIYNSGLNPLGYDNRYVPMTDFGILLNNSKNALGNAYQYKTEFDAETRNFDSNIDSLRNQINYLNGSYTESLSSLTDCDIPDPLDQQQISDFIDCTGVAGGDLFDCSVDLAEADFENCVASKQTKRGLADKYRKIKEAQIRLESARLNRSNILEKINFENERQNKLVELKRSSQAAQTVLLDEYYKKLKNARTEQDTVQYISTREKIGGEWVKSPKQKVHTTTETFYIKNEQLLLDTQKAKDLLQITTDYEIKQIDLDSAYAIKNLLLSEAEAELEIELAAHQKNSAIADFDNTFKEKENLWFLYQNALEQLRDISENKIPMSRVLKAQATIKLSEALNYTAHHAYLAAKAYEYKYLKPIVNEPVAGRYLRLTDLFKAQTPGDLSKFIGSLEDLNNLGCTYGTMDMYRNPVSLADDLLGLKNQTAAVKKEKVQAFINTHINGNGNLEFSFTLSEANSFLSSNIAYNLKIWSGPPPSPCSVVDQPKGVAVSIFTSQSTAIRSRVYLSQSGHSSLRNGAGAIFEYIPIYDSHFLFEGSGDYSPIKETTMFPFVNVDLLSNPGATGGEWRGAFTGRGISSSDWTMRLDNTGDIDISKIQDIKIYIDAIGQCCLN